MHITDAAWMTKSDGWIPATDRAARPASDDGPYELAGMRAGVLLARPGAMLDDPPLAAQTLDDPPPRHNDGSSCPPLVHDGRFFDDRPEVSSAHSLRILGEPTSMRAELGGIHLPLRRLRPTSNNPHGLSYCDPPTLPSEP